MASPPAESPTPPPEAQPSGPPSEPAQVPQKPKRARGTGAPVSPVPKPVEPVQKNGNGEETAKQGVVLAEKQIERVSKATGLPREFVVLEVLLSKEMKRLLEPCLDQLKAINITLGGMNRALDSLTMRPEPSGEVEEEIVQYPDITRESLPARLSSHTPGAASAKPTPISRDISERPRLRPPAKLSSLAAGQGLGDTAFYRSLMALLKEG